MAAILPLTRSTRSRRRHDDEPETVKLGTKADTLAALQDRLRCARVLPLVAFTVRQWRQRPAQVLGTLRARFNEHWPLIVRSSACIEDGAEASMAGAYLSISGVDNWEALADAVERVIESYGNPRPADQVLIQPCLQQVRLAGVVLTRDPATGGHYYVVNYDPHGDTAAVTAGKAGSLITYVASKCAPQSFPAPVQDIVALAREVESLTGRDALDIEFAQDRDGHWVLLQARPLVLPNASLPRLQGQAHMLEQVAAAVGRGMAPHPHLHGARTAYGVMPDWNPAEIIGIRPRPLALSLYRDLITDTIWSYQRNNYGYKNLRGFPLMRHFFGLPYIDVRVSLNSFIPEDIDGQLADRLANFYLERLLAAPALHDKVEFEIVFSCYTFDLQERLAVLREHGFTAADTDAVAGSLRTLTNGIIRADGLWRVDRDKLATLEQRRERLLAADMDDVARIHWLLEDCRRYGTLPFAGLARAAFIAVQMLRSLISTGILSDADCDAFMNGLNTVSSRITRDFAGLDRAQFLARYGHLRPGTYDILSPRYDEAADLYFDWRAREGTRDRAGGSAPSSAPFSLSIAQMKEIAKALRVHGLEYDVVGLLDFIGAAIEWREQSKFIFTRNLSDALSLLRRYGEGLGFSAEDLSFADIGVVTDLNVATVDARAVLQTSIDQGRVLYEQSRQLQLPALITRPEDVWGYALPTSAPNYITHARATAPVARPRPGASLTGTIVAIESADPGFDWIFSHGIAGLITAYGGANSHMAIRAAELGLPAVIGAGESLFQHWSQARMLMLDCANRRVEVLR